MKIIKELTRSINAFISIYFFLFSKQMYEIANELDKIKKEKEKLQEELNNQKFKEVGPYVYLSEL